MDFLLHKALLGNRNVTIGEAKASIEYFRNGDYGGIKEVIEGVNYWCQAFDVVSEINSPEELLDKIAEYIGSPDLPEHIIQSKYNAVQAVMKGFINASKNKYKSMFRTYDTPEYAIIEAFKGFDALWRTLLSRKIRLLGGEIDDVTS